MHTQPTGRQSEVSWRAFYGSGAQQRGLRLALWALLLSLIGSASDALPPQQTILSVGSGSRVSNPVAPVVTAPAGFTAGATAPTTVELSWVNQGAPQTLVSRQVNGGLWTLIKTYGALAPNSMTSFLDTAATSDAENCYVAAATDGVVDLKPTPWRCVFTPDGRTQANIFTGKQEPLFVHRVQLRLRVPDVPGAATDDDVEVRLQSPDWLVPAVTNWSPAGNSTWVDSTADDFERGSNRTYDLILTHLTVVSDITMITVDKATGTDNLCIAELELLIDGMQAFHQTFGEQATTCAWVTPGHPLTVDFATLRASTAWKNLVLPPFLGIDGAWLRSWIETSFANALHGKGALRNGGTTTSQRISVSTLHMTIPIVAYNVPVLGDVDSDVHFDLVITPVVVNGKAVTQIAVENVEADSSDLIAYFIPVVAVPILSEVSSEIEDQVAKFPPVLVDQSPICFTPDAGIGLCTSTRQQASAPVASH